MQKKHILILMISLLAVFSCNKGPDKPPEDESSPYKIVYLANRPADNGTICEVHLAELDASTDLVVHESDTLFHTLTWWGNYFYIATQEAGHGQLYYLRFDGKYYAKYLNTESIPTYDLKFSTNGKYILADADHKFSIVNLNDLKLITFTGKKPIWLPNKSTVYFEQDNNGKTQISRVAANDEEATIVVQSANSTLAPSFNTDGDKMAYAVVKNDSSFIYVADVDGSNAELKTAVAYPVVCTFWAPNDDANPFFITQGGPYTASSEQLLWRCNASSAVSLYKALEFKRERVWHPENDVLFFLEKQENGQTTISTYNLVTAKKSIWNFEPDLDILDFFITFGR